MKEIPMLDLKLEYEYMKSDIDSAIQKCLDHQKWIFGPEVKMLEEAIAKYLNVKNCIGCSSGTEALVLSLRALAIKTKGQEYFDKSDLIITTPFTFTATGDAILRSGATPVFVDIDPVTYNIDPVRIREALVRSKESVVKSSTTHSSPFTPHGSQVVGLLPVHLYGQSCQMDEIMAIAEEHKLFVVEDIAQAFGGTWKGKKLGSIGATGCFSFFPSKNLGGFGDGGMVSTSDDQLNDLMRMLLKHGGKDKYNVDHIGYNARLDTLQAAVLLAKFKYIDEFNDRRRKIAELYNDGLKGLEGLVLPLTPCSSPLNDSCHVYHQYTIRVPSGKRDSFQKHLSDKGVSTMIYYPFPLHKMKVFGDGRSKTFGSLELSEKAAVEVVSLPVEPLMLEEDVQSVIQAIKGFSF